MPITADFHLHSHFSGDSDTPMEEMILKGISLGLSALCFTEHNDFDFPDSAEEPGSIFVLNTDSYLYDVARLKEKYADSIGIFFGVELGLQPEIAHANAGYCKSYPFDFIIDSSHICHGKDPYYPDFFAKRSEEEALREYFQSILENIKKFSNFDVYGHLDYAVRYAPHKDQNYSYTKYCDIIDDILTLLLEKGKGLELNTGGIKKGMRDMHPCKDILKRYRELGGEIITVGSDSHNSSEIGSHFRQAGELLMECGFKYYCIFEQRTPEFHKLS